MIMNNRIILKLYSLYFKYNNMNSYMLIYYSNNTSITLTAYITNSFTNLKELSISCIVGVKLAEKLI